MWCPIDAAMEAIEACGRAGVAVATVLTDGFAEVGEAGAPGNMAARDRRERPACAIVGPSSLGIVNLRNGPAHANAAFDEPDLPAGRIFAASHSGGMIGTLLSRARSAASALRVYRSANEVDVSLGEICDAVLAIRTSTAICCSSNAATPTSCVPLRSEPPRRASRYSL